MSLRPLDMQVMMPKLEHVAQMKHAENHKPEISQTNIVHENQKGTQTKMRSVVQTNKSEDGRNDTDAKEEGKNKYTYQKPKARKDSKVNTKKNNQEDDEYHGGIDIKI